MKIVLIADQFKYDFQKRSTPSTPSECKQRLLSTPSICRVETPIVRKDATFHGLECFIKWACSAGGDCGRMVHILAPMGATGSRLGRAKAGRGGVSDRSELQRPGFGALRSALAPAGGRGCWSWLTAQLLAPFPLRRR
jgi:hypothetical protein